jgi:hypothetical protein
MRIKLLANADYHHTRAIIIAYKKDRAYNVPKKIGDNLISRGAAVRVLSQKERRAAEKATPAADPVSHQQE